MTYHRGSKSRVAVNKTLHKTCHVWRGGGVKARHQRGKRVEGRFVVRSAVGNDARFTEEIEDSSIFFFLSFFLFSQSIREPDI